MGGALEAEAPRPGGSAHHRRVARSEGAVGIERGADEAERNESGKVNGREVISGTTNAAGELHVTFASGVVPGVVGVRAELLNNGVSVRDDRVELTLLATERTIYLPKIER